MSKFFVSLSLFLFLSPNLYAYSVSQRYRGGSSYSYSRTFIFSNLPEVDAGTFFIDVKFFNPTVPSPPSKAVLSIEIDGQTRTLQIPSKRCPTISVHYSESAKSINSDKKLRVTLNYSISPSYCRKFGCLYCAGNIGGEVTLNYVAKSDLRAEISHLSPFSNVRGAGERIDITYKISNYYRKESRNFDVEFFYCTTPNDKSCISLNTVRIIRTFKAGESSTFYTQLTLPDELSYNGGFGYIRIYVDSSGEIPESFEDNNDDYFRFSLSRNARPNLKISSVQLSNSRLRPGDLVDVLYSLENSGRSRAENFKVRLYLSLDSAISPGDIYLNVERTVSLRAGEKRSFSDKIRLPNSTAAGYYWIGVFADVDGIIGETDEGDNGGGAKFYSRGLPDLSVSNLSLSAPSVVQGGKLTVSFRVENLGSAPAPPSVARIYLSSTGGTGGGVSIPLVDVNIPGIGVGKGIYRNAAVRIPPYYRTGKSYISVRSDYGDGIRESVETNNWRRIAVDILGVPDLIVSDMQAVPSIVSGGIPILVSFKVKNLGGKIANNFSVRLYFSRDSDITTGDIYLGREFSLSLSPGRGSQKLSAQLRLPSNLPYGTGYIGAIVDYNSRIAESVEDNNTGYVAISVRDRRPDLRLSSFRVYPVSVGGAGSTLTLRFTLENVGLSPASKFYISFYYSDSANSPRVFLKRIWVNYSIGRHSHKNFSINVILPPSVLFGRGRLIHYYVDSSENIDEWDESNNRGAVPFEVTGKPDIVIQFLSVTPGSQYPGGKLQISYRLYNVGYSKIPVEFLLNFFYTEGMAVSSGDLSLGVVKIPSNLGARSHYPPSGVGIFSAVVPVGAKSGKRYIRVSADLTGKIKDEGDKKNNVGYTSFIVLKNSADLVFSSFSVSPKVQFEGGNVTVSFSVANRGNRRASDFYVRLYLSKDRKISAKSDIYLNFEKKLSLGPGDTFGPVSAVVSLPLSLSYKTAYIGGIVDYNHRIVESDEGNNTASALITVRKRLPDLSVDKFTLSSYRGLAGQKVGFFAQVSNRGKVDSGKFRLGIYYSRDPVIDRSDILLSVISVTGLSRGNTRTLSGKFTLAKGLKKGPGYIGVFADFDSRVGEVDEGNNFRSVSFQVLEDRDGDGVPAGVDCDDRDRNVYPPYLGRAGAKERCDGKDNDCDGIIDPGCPEPSVEKYSSEGEHPSDGGTGEVGDFRSEFLPEEKFFSEVGGEQPSDLGTSEGNCYRFGCPEGEICLRGECRINPCSGVKCGPDEFCRNGVCVRACGCKRCGVSEFCFDGICVPNPCAGIQCRTGYYCDRATAKCVKDLCFKISCTMGKICRKGRCVDDPCNYIICPVGQFCRDGQCFGKGCFSGREEVYGDGGNSVTDVGEGEVFEEGQVGIDRGDRGMPDREGISFDIERDIEDVHTDNHSFGTDLFDGWERTPAEKEWREKRLSGDRSDDSRLLDDIRNLERGGFYGCSCVVSEGSFGYYIFLYFIFIFVIRGFSVKKGIWNL